jgi:hypothetical protein
MGGGGSCLHLGRNFSRTKQKLIRYNVNIASSLRYADHARHHRVTALTHLESAGPYLTMGLSTDLNIFQKQYRNKIQTELK